MVNTLYYQNNLTRRECEDFLAQKPPILAKINDARTISIIALLCWQVHIYDNYKLL